MSIADITIVRGEARTSQDKSRKGTRRSSRRFLRLCFQQSRQTIRQRLTTLLIISMRSETLSVRNLDLGKDEPSGSGDQ